MIAIEIILIYFLDSHRVLDIKYHFPTRSCCAENRENIFKKSSLHDTHVAEKPACQNV